MSPSLPGKVNKAGKEPLTCKEFRKKTKLPTLSPDERRGCQHSG